MITRLTRLIVLPSEYRRVFNARWNFLGIKLQYEHALYLNVFIPIKKGYSTHTLAHFVCTHILLGSKHGEYLLRSIGEREIVLKVNVAEIT